MIRMLLAMAVCYSVSAFAEDVRLSQERVIFHTNLGDIVVAFYPDVAPKHTARILEMVREGLYAGVPVGRIEKGFVAQVYNQRTIALTPEKQALITKIPAEFNSVLHRRGVLSMARYDEDVNSADFSFSFMLGDAPHLDHHYTVFGQVIAGYDVLAAIEMVPVTATAPDIPVMIESAEVIADGNLTEAQLAATHARPMPFQKGKVLFQWFAGLMFFFTVSTPIVKSVFKK